MDINHFWRNNWWLILALTIILTGIAFLTY